MSELEQVNRRLAVVLIKQAAMAVNTATSKLHEAFVLAEDVGDVELARTLRRSAREITTAKVRAGRAISPRPTLIEPVPDHVPEGW